MGSFDWGAFGQSAGNSFLSNVFSWFGAKQQHKRNKELMSLQNDYTLGQMAQSNEYWKEQNATQVQNQMDLTQSNPILQKVGMQQAGMNTNAQFSGNVAAAPSGTNAPSGNGVGNPGASNPFSSAIDLFGQMNQLKIQKAQQKLIDAQERVASAEAEGKQIENKYKEQEHQKGLELSQSEINKNEQQRQTFISQQNLNDAERDNWEKSTSWIDKLNQASLDKVEQEIKESIARVENQTKQLLQEIKESDSRIALNAAKSEEARANAGRANAEALESAARRAGVLIDNAIKGIEYAVVSNGGTMSDASAFGTMCRREILDYVQGRSNDLSKLDQLITKQYQKEYHESGNHGPFGSLDIVREFYRFIDKAKDKYSK